MLEIIMITNFIFLYFFSVQNPSLHIDDVCSNSPCWNLLNKNSIRSQWEVQMDDFVFQDHLFELSHEGHFNTLHCLLLSTATSGRIYDKYDFASKYSNCIYPFEQKFFQIKALK